MKLGFLVSGRGSNMQSIIAACESGKLAATPVVVISNNASAKALEIARSHNIPAIHLSAATHPQAASLDRAITDTLKQHGVDLVILAGYMKKVGTRLLQVYHNHILNIHPSLLPRFGGKGMYGMHVHQTVLDSGDTWTGVTIHLVNEHYDQGQVLAQEKVAVLPGDTPESLARRVLAVEHELYISVIADIVSGRIILPP